MAIQQIWLEQDFDQVTLETICGQQVKIEFAGWYNSASGPDFRGGGAHWPPTLIQKVVLDSFMPR